MIRIAAAMALLTLIAGAAAQDADGVYVLTKPERTVEQIEQAYSEMPPLVYTPQGDRWKRLPRTARILQSRKGELRIVMLGDSIVNDTSRSSFDALLQQRYPKTTISKVTVVRGSTGCWWYKDAGRVQKYVLPQNPDLLIIGGISHHDDTESVREVVRQVRASSKCDILLMTGAFGTTDPRDDKQWTAKIDPKGDDFRARLQRLASEEKCGFLDMTGVWGQYIRDSGKELEWFKRDPIHANARGEQILGRILLAYLSR